MKAIVYTKYGPPDVLQLKEVEKPTPKEDEVLVKVHATSVNYSDWAFVRGKPFLVRLVSGLLKPKKILGADIAGRVEAVGKNVNSFSPGDEVFGDISGCGWGGFAEYVSVAENALALKPANLTFAEAAAVPQAAVVALQGLRNKRKIQPGQKVLINGASGGIGTFAVQIAKSFGAEVTGVCSTRNLEMVRSIGADKTIDYTREDFVNNEQRYDLVLATAGYRSIFDYKRALNPRGIYVMTGGSMKQIMQANILGPAISKAGGKKLVALSHKPSQNDLVFMKELIEAGKVVPVIDRCYPLIEVAEALSYYGEGHARGKVVITMEHNNKT
ncbi:MAG: NAD(P)-dependent alcohol dehydrogenase [Planctomycetota bacterium]|jgi:NADPH:quinone reductase-like Zn-dependent oxidoreductase